MSDKKTCFVITPIGDENSKIRRHIDGIIDAVIVPTLCEYGFEEPIVPHRLYNSTAITKQIYKDLKDADLVIANLTELNPNVMYELAIRFCIGKPVIIIAEEGTKLPFDVKDQRTFFYINDSKGALELRDKIKNALNKIDYSKKETSPIFDAIGEIELLNQLNNEEHNSSDKDRVSDKALSLILEKLDDLEVKVSQRSVGVITERTIHNSNKGIGEQINALNAYVKNTGHLTAEEENWVNEIISDIEDDLAKTAPYLSVKTFSTYRKKLNEIRFEIKNRTKE